MKVAMIDPSLFTGRYDDGLCAALAGQGHDVTLMGRPLRRTDAIMPTGYRYDPAFFRLSEALRPMIGEGLPFRAMKGVGHMLRCAAGSVAPFAGRDVAHFQWLPLARADAMLLRRLKGKVALVHTVHNAQAYHADGGGASVQGHGYGALLGQFDALIVHGEPTREALLRGGIVDEAIHIVPHPPMRLKAADAHDLAAVPDAHLPRILLFGTLRPYKGLDVLVQACLALWEEGLGFELAIAGKPFFDVDPLFAPVHERGFGEMLVYDPGFHEEGRLDAHLRKADIIAFPYRHIDSSGAFLSALHYAKAMVASRTGMFAGLNGDAVALSEPGDAAGLADALRPLIRNGALRQAAGARAAILGQALTDWDDAAQATARVYERAMGNR